VAFACAKTRLAFDVEDPRDVGARALLDDLVGIVKILAQVLGEQATNRGLAGPHGADEKYVIEGLLHVGTPGPMIPRPGRLARTAAPWRALPLAYYRMSLMIDGVMKISNSVLLSVSSVRLKMLPT